MCMAAMYKLLKRTSKSLAKFAPLGRLGVLPRNGAGTVLGSMPWMVWAADATPEKSSPLAKRVSRSIFLWRGLKVSF